MTILIIIYINRTITTGHSTSWASQSPSPGFSKHVDDSDSYSSGRIIFLNHYADQVISLLETLFPDPNYTQKENAPIPQPLTQSTPTRGSSSPGVSALDTQRARLSSSATRDPRFPNAMSLLILLPLPGPPSRQPHPPETVFNYSSDAKRPHSLSRQVSSLTWKLRIWGAFRVFFFVSCI